MEFDYCNVELDEIKERLFMEIGCKFQDEPEELYVIQMTGEPSGTLKEVRLLFNTMDCRYSFKEDELASLLEYVREQLSSSEYAEWFEALPYYG
ncbi:hypothetical protein GCM10023310_54200 [Paenibacillus vulneris]|uniref:Uncharacterized protein n=1 Tax=Paenibacillus vulneris TaxID=1133364 RepID=A0ABW3UD53_9BACL